MAGKLIITWEGIEASGKDTQLDQVQGLLASKNVPFESFREPGGTGYAELTRNLIKDKEIIKKYNEQYNDSLDESESLDPLAEAYLFFAARAQLFSQIKDIQDKVILINRSIDSTIAYQGFGRFHGEEKYLNNFLLNNTYAIQGEKIHRTYFLDISVDELHERKQKFVDPEKIVDRMEDNKKDFFERTRQGYFWLAEKNPERIKVINGEQPFLDVFNDIKKDLDVLLDEHGYSPKAL